VLLFGGSPHDLNPRRSVQSTDRHSLRRLPERFARPLAQTWVRKSLLDQSYYLKRGQSRAPSRREQGLACGLGHARSLTPHCGVIQDPRAALLPRPTITRTVEDACPYVIPLFPSQISPSLLLFPTISCIIKTPQAVWYLDATFCIRAR
jgi:hypothetical protein